MIISPMVPGKRDVGTLNHVSQPSVISSISTCICF